MKREITATADMHRKFVDVPLPVFEIYRRTEHRVVPAMKLEATARGDPQDGRWKITIMFDGRRFFYQNLGILRYSRLHVNDVIGDFRPRPPSA